MVVPTMLKGRSTRRHNADCKARFSPGERVRTRNINPTGHTRLPRYARGRNGIVDQIRGTFVFPDTNSAMAGESPQTVYSVRFRADDLWGEGAPYPNDAIYLDLWDAYLEPI